MNLYEAAVLLFHVISKAHEVEVRWNKEKSLLVELRKDLVDEVVESVVCLLLHVVEIEAVEFLEDWHLNLN